METKIRRILKFTKGPADWQAFLSDPTKHWVRGYSARTLAHSWEAANGFPPEVAATLGASMEPLMKDLSPVLAVPEFKVPLPGGDRASQNDIFVLATSSAGPVAIMVEGKVNESFGPTLGDWRAQDSPGKKTRLKFLCRTIGLKDAPDENIRYQLLHRSASAIIEGERFHAVAAVMLVHSFSERRTGLQDYKAFLRLYGVAAEVGQLQMVTDRTAIPLFAAWVPGDLKFVRA